MESGHRLLFGVPHCEEYLLASKEISTMNTFLVQDTQIHLTTDPSRGSQTIVIQDTDLGRRLASVLGSSKFVDGYLLLEHTPDLDELVVALVDVLVAMRYNHPRLMQIQYTLPGVLA
jgi:hypothetical protein